MATDTAARVRVSVSKLTDLVTKIFVYLKMPEADARVVADALVDADLRGHESHGVSNYIRTIYYPGIVNGIINPQPNMRIVHETSTTSRWDADGAMGHVSAYAAMNDVIERAKKRLKKLGIFKSADVKAEPGSSPDRVRLTFTVVEDETGNIGFGGGYSTSEGIIADVTFKERNLMGRGQFLQVKLGGSLEGRKQIDVNFTEPRFLDQNLSAGVDLFHKEVDLTKEAGYSNMRTGAGLRLGVPLSDETWITGRYTFSREEVFDVQDDASLFVKESEGTDFVSAVGYTLSYDTRNIKANPTSGIYLELAQDFAGLGGDVNYIRTVAEARGYYPITDQITFVTRVTGGQIEGWGGQDVRLSDLFYRGGETVRGFDKAGYGPRDAKTGDALGGKLFYAATAEVRFPLPYVPDDLGLSGAVFADAGSLFTASDRAKELDAQGKVDLQDSDSIRSSVGVSLIWNSPLGPLRADYAYVLTKEAFDDEQAFRFGASTRF